MPATEADPGPTAPRWSAERRPPGCAGGPTPRKRGVALYERDIFKAGASRRSAHPSVGGCCEEEAKNPGAETRHGNEETALFDIVKMERREWCIANRSAIASTATHSAPAEGALRCVLGERASTRARA